MGVAVYTQLALKADSRRCGQWTVLVQNPVVGERGGREDVGMANTSCLGGRPWTLAWRMRSEGVKGAGNPWCSSVLEKARVLSGAESMGVPVCAW